MISQDTLSPTLYGYSFITTDFAWASVKLSELELKIMKSQIFYGE